MGRLLRRLRQRMPQRRPGGYLRHYRVLRANAHRFVRPVHEEGARRLFPQVVVVVDTNPQAEVSVGTRSAFMSACALALCACAFVRVSVHISVFLRLRMRGGGVGLGVYAWGVFVRVRDCKACSFMCKIDCKFFRVPRAT